MTETPTHIDKTLEDLKQQLSIKMAEVKRLLTTINSLEEYAGLPKTVFQDAGVAVSVHDSASISEAVDVIPRGVSRIRPDEFLGEDPLKAAKKYIGRVGHAVGFDEIADAVSRGGAATKGADWRERLKTGLIRSTHDIVKVQDDTFGLTGFYTDELLKNLREARRPQSTGSGQKKRGRPRKSTERTGAIERKAPRASAKSKEPESA
jgi:hypothetical protein